VLFATRVTESTLDYSLSSTARQALWLVTSREAKYKAKQVVDSFMWRAGDAVSAGVVWLGKHYAASNQELLSVNVVCALIWGAIAWYAGQSYAQRVLGTSAAPGTQPQVST
jgi:AAA family ATP:ADP antiporter